MAFAKKKKKKELASAHYLCVMYREVVSIVSYLVTCWETKWGLGRGEEEMRENGVMREKRKKRKESEVVVVVVMFKGRGESEENVRRRGCI